MNKMSDISGCFDSVLTRDERAVFTLRALYRKYGYSHYRMSKFEEYDLYVRNKDFLVSDNIITFTDTDGRLLALKPDVTLSIIKNSRDSDSGVMKVYYNENVYRVSKGTRTFREIMQVGLECIGEVSDDEIREVLTLAKESLTALSHRCVLEISHLDIVSGVLSHFGISNVGCKRLLSALGQKNAQAMRAVCKEEGVDGVATRLIEKLATIYGTPDAVMPLLDEFRLNATCSSAIDQLGRVTADLGECVRIDFSVVGDMSYYNGLAFKGFIDGIPTGILSGGQYDRLMKKMQRHSRAVGFAVYLDELEKLSREAE